MDPIVGGIVTPVVDSLMVHVKKHLRYLISCPKYVRDMRTKMKKLKTIRLDVERCMNNNNSNSLEVPKEIDAWLKEVETIDAQVETIPIDVGSCFNLKVRYKLGKEASKIIPEINRLIGEKSMIDWTEIPIPPAEVNSPKASTSTPSSDYNDFESRKLIYMEAFNALKADNKPYMIALCGMGGVGKTTMMEKLQKAVRENKMFHFVIKVAIGEKKNVSEFIQTAIAEQLAIDLKETTKEARVDKLRNAFKGRSKDGKNKFLVILDDLWESVDLKDIGLSPKPDQGIDFKVLLTSRDRKLCIQMGVERDSIFNLEVIKDSEAQVFFFQFAKISDDSDLRKIGRDITIRCHGLPIAIKTIACTLNGESKHVWEDTLTKLEHKNVGEAVGEVFTISYKHLHDEETRLTLLLCGLFPEDFDTPTEDLVRYSFGLKLFRNVDSIREARNRLKTCIERLIHANLLIQSQEVGCVKMHDLVLGFVLDVLSKDEHSSIVGKWPAEPMREYCKKISLTCSGRHDFPRDLKYPKLSLLKLMHGEESLRFPEDFYKGMEQLKVIAYDEMCLLHLRSLECSSNLRTLCLHECSLLSDCSSIGNLSNLEVLSFAHSTIHKLPSTMVKLTKLKLLDLTKCWCLCIDDGILKSLVNLEELYMRGVRRLVNIEEPVECSENLGALEIEFFFKDDLPQNLSFKNLERFRISLGCHLDKIDGKSKYSFENTLMLAIDERELLDYGMNELFKKTEVLYLQVNGINDFGDGLGALLHNLRVLGICKCTNLRYLFTIRVANGLKQLERLEIDECPVLETLVDSHEICEVDQVIMLPSLKFLSLKWLPMLTSLCKNGNVIELPQLEELELRSLPNFSNIYQDFLKKEVMSSKLKRLEIKKMEKLKEIWPSQLSNNEVQVIYSQLRVIKVEGCDSLVNLFPSNPMSLLHHLEQLEVRECGSIDVIFNIDLGSSSCGVVGGIKEDHSSNLRSIEVRDCEELREVWRVKGVNNHLPILGFQNVEEIQLFDCKSLRNVFTPTTSSFDMKALTTIIIYGDWEENKSKEVEEINVVAFLSHLIHTCRYLRTLHIYAFKTVEVAFEIETPNSRKLTTTLNNQQQQPLLPHLKDLDLRYMETMTHVWKYDWNQFLISQQEPTSSSFLNLTSITLYYCNSLKCLFSPFMAKLLPNLNSIKIEKCDAIEEVVSNIDDEYEEIATSISSHSNTTFFLHLEILDLSKLRSLKRIDGVGFQHSSNRSFYQYLKTIKIKKCDALLNVIPSHAVGEMSKLEELKISKCDSLREIFEIEGVNKDVVGDITDIGEGSSDMGSAMTIIPRLTNMTNSLPNLKVLHIEGCDGLKYIFTSSTLESLKKLQELKIENCSAIQVIVKQEDNNGLIIASSKDVMVFPRLKSLTLVRLPNLKGFFLGKSEFRWPLLDKVEMYGCPQMMIFTSGVLEAPKLKYIHTGVGKHSLECGLNFDWANSLQHEEHIQLYNSRMCSTLEYLQFPWSFPNLIEVDVGLFDELSKEETIFPRIEEAVVDKVEFEGTNDETQSNKKPQLLMTSMDHPPTSSSCIWKIHSSNLSNLTKVSLDWCHNLEHVFSYGMAASLEKLQDLHISRCKSMKVIVEAMQDYSETNKAKDVVSFPCLKSLQLTHLWSLKGFCLGSDQDFQWPSLHTLKIMDCPRMTVFTKGQSTTPKLKVIKTRYGLCEATEDLNSSIRTRIQEGYEF